MLARQTGERDRKRVQRVVGEDDERPHEVVPGAEEAEDRERGDNRFQERHDHGREDAQLAGAVDARRLEQLVGDAARELAHEEDAEDARHGRHDRAGVGVDQAQGLEHQEERQHRDLSRYHQGTEQKAKEGIAAAKAQLGEGIAGHEIEGHGDGGGRAGDEQAVEQVAAHADAAEQGAVVLERRRRRQDRRRQRRRRPRRHERGREHPEQRKEGRRRERGEQTVDEPDGEARVHRRPGASRSKRSITQLTQKMTTKRRNATAEALPRFHQRKPSSYMR